LNISIKVTGNAVCAGLGDGDHPVIANLLTGFIDVQNPVACVMFCCNLHISEKLSERVVIGPSVAANVRGSQGKRIETEEMLSSLVSELSRTWPASLFS
jgi:hypothetical protein